MRKSLITKFVTKDHKGIEIAPWHNPIVPKRDGYSVQVLDIFDTEMLREKCIADPNIPPDHLANIEEVDFVASALDIDEAVKKVGGLGSYDYIVSSHNFEHLPNPVRFLQACGKVLRTGGCLSMAIPAKNFTFDYFRNLTTTTDFLESYFENRTRPSPFQIYDFASCFADNVPSTMGQQTKGITFSQDFETCYRELKDRLDQSDSEYIDTHVSVFTPDSFNLIISEIITLELIPFRIKEILSTNGFEFFAHLERIDSTDIAKHKLRKEDRIKLYHKIYGLGLPPSNINMRLFGTY
jgi:SAM-dependent methyltransferase